ADGRVNLHHLFKYLTELDIRTVMIEGGAKIITSMLKTQLADQLVLAISPRILGGVRGVESLCEVSLEARPRLKNVHFESVAGEMVIHGEFPREEA
ncbi:MAG: dihydrofolate reductase family protein, partial [Gammaproteobacteria bacterium]|nr:dihydrofolate reductase family protein [Gammaproteobacteria bacterium]